MRKAELNFLILCIQCLYTFLSSVAKDHENNI